MEGYRSSDFVLGMSLAEISLLLIFALFAATVEAEQDETLPTVCEVALRECKRERTELTSRVQELEREVASLQRQLDYLLRMVGANDFAGAEEAVDALKRGYRRCDSDANVLIHVEVHDGAERVRIVALNEELEQFLRTSNVRFLAGDELSASKEITRFLDIIRTYHGPRNCRYDYSGSYRTDQDYRMMRDRYERYFYPAGGIQRVGER